MQGNGDLYLLFLRPRLLCCFPLAHVFQFLFIFLREVVGYAYLSISPPPFSYLTTHRLRGANIFSLLLSVEPAYFPLPPPWLSLRDRGAEAFLD